MSGVSRPSSGGTRLHAIVNPAAGNRRGGKRWESIAKALSKGGYDAQPHFTTAPGDATAIARRLAEQGADIIVGVGGDGTANEIVNGLIVAGKPVNLQTRLALIPTGTGKDLSRSLGTRNAAATMRALSEGTIARVDVGRMRYLDNQTGEPVTRYFANMADAGLGAETAARINRSRFKAFGGTFSYMSGAIGAIARYKPWDAIVEVDGHPVFAGDAGMILFANGRYHGGGMRLAPQASLCDGLLDVFVVEGVGKRALLTSLLPRVYLGRHVGQPGVSHLRGSTATIRSEAGMLVEMDGEQVGGTPVSVDVLPRILTVIGRKSALRRVGGCVSSTE